MSSLGHAWIGRLILRRKQNGSWGMSLNPGEMETLWVGGTHAQGIGHLLVLDGLGDSVIATHLMEGYPWSWLEAPAGAKHCSQAAGGDRLFPVCNSGVPKLALAALTPLGQVQGSCINL